MPVNGGASYIAKHLITASHAVGTCLCLTEATWQIPTRLAAAENRWDPCSGVDPKRRWMSRSFISIHKHFPIPGRAAQLSVLSLCLRVAGRQLCMKEKKAKHSWREALKYGFSVTIRVWSFASSRFLRGSEYFFSVIWADRRLGSLLIRVKQI